MIVDHRGGPAAFPGPPTAGTISASPRLFRGGISGLRSVPPDGGRLCLAAVEGMATMEMVGWSMSDRLKSSLAVNAMRMALRSRPPASGLICHPDRGVQYAAGDHRQRLDDWKAHASLGRKGDCLGKAPMESLFASLKDELVHRTRSRSRQEAKAALFGCIAIFCNRRRRHPSIGDRTPEQARIDMSAAIAAYISPAQSRIRGQARLG